MGKIYLPFFFFCLLSGLNQKVHAQLSCGTDEIHRRLLQSNPAYKKTIELQNARWAQYVKVKTARANRPAGTKDDLYEIPVVIHVIHTGQDLGSVYNPSDATLYALIDELNQKYAATWPSYPGVGNGGVNIPIRFKLAQRTPDCQPTNGINRVNGSSLPGYSQFGVAFPGSNLGTPDITVKSLSIWPNTAYLNVWIVTNIQGTSPGGGGIAGYATPPVGWPPNQDGIVLDADYTNSSLTHETGHYFGLWHTFSGSNDATTCPPNNDCNTDGDLVCDTDPHALVFGCPTGTNPCTGMSYEPVVYNIMNYSSCRNRFTDGQADRMIFTLENFRSSLLTSLGGLQLGTDIVIPSPVASCVPIGTHDPDNLADIGPRTVMLADMQVITLGYTGDNNQYYIDNTIPNCLQNQLVAHLNSGIAYTITVTTGPHSENVRGWIDFNNDGTFQSTELILSSNGTTSFQTHTATFTVPTNGVASCTSLRMRIMSDFAEGNPPPQPCSSLQWGQAEDFIVIIQDPASSVPSVSIAINNEGTICEGTNVIFTATPVNGGNNPAYQWKLNGNEVGSNNNTYSNNTLADGDVISCVMTSSAQDNCTPTATSNSITMSVNRTVIPTITINASQNNICSGATVVFTATETNGAYPSTQWKINGVNVTGNGYLTYTSSTLADGDVVTCVMTSAEPCANPKTVTSNSIVMKVIATLAPSVSIAINNEGPICDGSTITFTATPANAGNNPAYQWKLNGTNVGDNSSTYSNNSLGIGDAIICVLTSSAQNNCNPTATSNRIYVHFDQTVIPSVSISASETNICAGATVVFTANVTNGAYPTLQWKINGVDVEGNGYLKYTSSTLADGDVVSCEMTSDLPCANPRKATSNSIAMKVNSTLAPSVSIAVNTEGPICEGANLTLTATPLNGGNSPAYQWKLNGNNVGSNSNTYSATLVNSDVVSCVMTSSAQNSCSPTATSNSIIIWTTPAVTPSVSISASENNICAGTNVTFIAYPVEGNEPDIKWKLNGNDVNRNSSSRYVYNTSTLADGDVVSCEMTSGYPCANPKSVTSNNIVMNVNASVTPSIAISASQNNICAGTNVTFTANPINGADPYLRWKVNGNEVQIGLLTYSSSTLADGDVVSCFMISEHPCASPKSAVSNNIVMKVDAAITPSVSITASQNNICAGTNVTFIAYPIEGAEPTLRWKVNGNQVRTGSQTYSSTTLADGDVVTCEMTSGYPCANPKTVTSNSIVMNVNASATPSITISASQNNICSGTSVTFAATLTNGGTNAVYQWKVGNTLVGTNSPTYTTTSLTNGAVVSCVLTSNSSCAGTVSVTSRGITMSVSPPTLITVAVAGPTIFCAGKNVLLKVITASGSTCQWKKAGIDIPGQTLPGFTAAATGAYTVEVTNAAGCSTISAPINVTVKPVPLAKVVAGGPLTFCAGKNVLLRATTGTGYTYQWKRGGVDIAGATLSNYYASTTGYYAVVVSNTSGCSTTSETLTVVVKPLPLATITPIGSTTICMGKNVLLRASSGINYTYQWKWGATPIVGAVQSTYAATKPGYYTVIVTNANGCSVTSAAIPVFVKSLPLATITPVGSTSICDGKNVLLKASPGTNYTYQWKWGATPIVGAVQSTYAASKPGYYTVIVTNATGCSVTSPAIPVIVKPLPTATISPVGFTTVCEGKTVLLRASTGTNYTYQWKKNGINLATQTLSSYTATATGVYSVLVTTAEGCSTLSPGINITMTPAPATTIIPNGPLSIPQGGSVMLSAPAAAGNIYQWKKDGVNIIGATSQSHMANTGGSYTVVVTNSSSCQATSLPVQVSVNSGRLITKGLPDADEYINVYPNPLYRSDYLNIDWSLTNFEKGLQVTVSDITGRLIESRILLKPDDKKIRLKGASGIYIVEIRWGKNERKIFRVIKIE